MLVWTPPSPLPAGGYAVYRGSNGSGSEADQPVGTASTDAHCYVDRSGVENDTTYCYFLKAFDAGVAHYDEVYGGAKDGKKPATA